MQAITTEIAVILLWIVSQHHRNHSAEIPGHLNKVCRRPFGKQPYLVHKSDMESFIIRERKQAKVFLQYCAADGQAHYDQLYHNSNLMEDLHCWPSDWYKWLHMWSLPWQRCTVNFAVNIKFGQEQIDFHQIWNVMVISNYQQFDFFLTV